ncbi:zinc finger homeobox protein 3 [Gastrophryne carolinensis]
MEGCDASLVAAKDNGCSVSSNQKWTDLNRTLHLDQSGNMEQPNIESRGSLESLSGSLNECISASANPSGANLQSPSRAVCCNECSSSFPSLQEYMEHHCPGTRSSFVLKEESESDDSDEGEESDVENLAGEIVYQPDGSAYIVESFSQLIQSAEACNSTPSDALSLPKNSLPNATGKSEDPSSAGSVYPQIINTFHIASSFRKWFENSDKSFLDTSTLSGISPVLHSFRVFDVRHKSNKDYLNSDGSAKSSCVSKDVPNNVDLSKYDGFVLYGKRKPILMCFLCKLSFGYVRSFVTHAVHDHRMTLSEDERKILSNKNISAIIQGIGKDKEPLISFLEPKNKSFPHPLVSSANTAGPANSFYGKFSGIRVDGDETLQASLALLKESDASRGVDQAQSNTMSQSPLLNLGGLTSSSFSTSVNSAPLSSSGSGLNKPSLSQKSESAEHEKYQVVEQDSLSERIEQDEVEEEMDEEGVDEEEEEEEDCKTQFSHGLEDDLMDRPQEESGAFAETTGIKDLAFTNQSISNTNLMPNVPQPNGRGTSTCSSSFVVFDGANGRNHLSFNSDDIGASMAEGGRKLDVVDESANRDSATAPEPNESAEGEDGSFSIHHQHADNPCELETGECSSGSGVECPKCDTVLGSSRSLGGHMTMMHSRNSCKTLKCPKCNWHYKYQQTLEAHMKEKHPEPGGTCSYCKSGQPHPRLARGESYTCGYKPFRCEVCNYSTTTKGNLSIHMQSDKHLNNMQNLQNGGSDQVFSHTAGVAVAAATVAAASNMNNSCGAPSPTKPKTKPTWRCEVCDYETNVARNLRIHMTSEKHMHNMMLLQQNMTQIQHNRHLGISSLPTPAEADLYHFYLAQNMNLKMDNPTNESQYIMGGFQLDPTSPMPGMAPTVVGGEIPLDMRLGGAQLVSEELMNLGESFTQTNDPSLKLFQCAVCNRFTTDNLDMLGLHMGAERSLPEEEWKSVVGDSYQCNLCRYNTQLKANFQLHCKTDKHIQKYQLVAHIKEGGKANEWRLKCVAIGNPVHLKCNACDYYTNSLEKLRLHTVNARHEASLKLYKHLQKHESSVEGETSYYHCVLCSYATKAKLNLIQHVRSMKHQRSESLRKLQRLQKGMAEEDEDLGQIFTIRTSSPPMESEDLAEDPEGACDATADAEEVSKDQEPEGAKDTNRGAAPVTAPSEQDAPDAPPAKTSSNASIEPPPKRPRSAEEKEQLFQCPYCKYTNIDINRLRVHAMTQHSVQPMLRCPLCQDMLNNKIHLQLHLTHLHSVAPDCVEKLIVTVTSPEMLMPSTMFLPVCLPDREKATSTMESTEKVSEPLEAVSKSSSVPTTEQRAPTSDHISAKEDSGFLCWKKGCNQVFKTSAALQTHFNEIHNKRPQLPVSDRHVYKYRCNQCSLAFKTIEKLQLHSQYHVIRAATMCCLCQRSFRTFQALKKHLETNHLELSEADIQQLYSGLLVNGDIASMGDAALTDDQSMLVDDDKDYESDLDEKQSPTGSDSGSVQDDFGSEPKRALPFRKGPNFTMEKFLDPSRPYKCTVCKESFTQKNILLVHYNSVSHLHKLKRALQDSNTGQPEPTSSPDNKPFKCNTCNVAYSQSSTLEIHMRSVLHQTKARAAKLEAASGSSNTVSATSTCPSATVTTTSNPVSSSASTTSSCTTTATTVVSSSFATQTSTESAVVNAGTANMVTAGVHCPSEHKEGNRKKLADMIASRQQQQQQHQAQTLAQAQAQVQAHLQQELQQQAAILQSQLLNPTLLPHFPMTTETLLQLQQQQHLLFPFYIPSTEFQFNPEVSLPLTSGTLTLTGSGSGLMEELKAPLQLSQQAHPPHQHLLQSQSNQMCMSEPHSTLLQHPEQKKPAKENYKELKKEKEFPEKTEETSVANEAMSDSLKCRDKKEPMPSSSFDSHLLPPRIASDARGNATKALLENFGFELVIQYNENKQKVQKKTGKTEQTDSLEKLECNSCGKFFSNILILKSHQEHVHQRYLPFKQLEQFAKLYRDQYEKLYPLRPQTPEAPPPPPPPPPPPATPQPAITPTVSTSAPPLTPPSISPAQSSVSLAQLSMPMELPIFPPLMMQPMPLQTMPAQLAPQLTPVETLSADLAQLYQHQLNPNLLQQQNKRPRTRITDDQLRVLRQYFDINNSPSEEQIKEMSDKSGLPQKVIKHWFRNTLFKERQRNKDSPYNFNNPPITSLEELKMDSRPPSPEPPKHEYWGSKRSSRTRFTDYQLRVLQDFFDANAYPKDDEFEQLSSLLNLPTRVIVVWFQNARQKARKNYENQGDGKEGDRRELSNDRYIRTSNLNYQCKKCSLVFQRIFDLIKHQKKLCYKDEDEDMHEDSQNEDSMDAMDMLTPSSSTCSTPMPFQSFSTAASTSSNTTSTPFPQHIADMEESLMCSSKPESSTNDKPKHFEIPRTQQNQTQEQPLQPKQESQQPETMQSQSQLQDQVEQKLTATPQKLPLSSSSTQPPHSSMTQSSPNTVQITHHPMKPLHSSTPQQLANLPPQIIPYQCYQCKLAFPSFEHWQEHQQLHFLSAQNQFIHPQFLDRPMDMPFMLFDPSNPLLASQLLSGGLSQIPTGSATSPSTPSSTMNSLKRKLEEKASASPGENDSGTGGEEPHRDKRLRTTITPEQLEILYQKYLLDSNPTRKMLDHIAHEVGLKKRVVQVWFQNTRARERKGQFRAVGPAQAHRRCPFCRALFKAKTALEAHIRSRHWHEAKRAGYNMNLSTMLVDCDGSMQLKADLFDSSHYSNLPHSSSDGQCMSLSPVSKSLDLSPQTLLSPSSIKVEGMEDYESTSISSVNLRFDQAKLDNDDCSSVNTAITDTTTGDEGNADNDSTTGILAETKSASVSSEGLPKSAMMAVSEYEDQMSSGLVSPAPSFYKEYENEGIVDYSETSSLADPCSPSPGASGSASKSGDSGDRPGQKRFRTQMTNLQLKVLKSCFNDYRTPTMLECEVLGNDIGLPKRVVQVWFQNARAKDKKSKLSMAKHFGINQTNYEGPKTECTLCGVKYSARLSVRDHIFSQQHISKVKETIGSQLDKEKEYFDPATVRQLMAHQELDRIKKANEVLGLTPQQQGVFDNPSLQALNLPTSYPALQGIPPGLLPGLGSPSLPGFTPTNTALSSPKSNVMGVTNATIPSPGLPTSGQPNKQPPTSLSPTIPSQTQPLPAAQSQELPKEKESGKIKEKERGKSKGEPVLKKEKGETPVSTSSSMPGMEYVVDSSQLQALQAALTSDPSALLTSQFLPYFVPGFSPYYGAQFPGALPGGYMQPVYGMEGIFPYSPAISQALMGLSPGSLLQQYQQYQQSLQEALQQQQRQLQMQQKQQHHHQQRLQQQQPKASQTPTPSVVSPSNKDPAKDSLKLEEQNPVALEVSHSKKPPEQREVENQGADWLLDPLIVPKVQYKLVCRKCDLSFSSEEAAVSHLKSLCFFGQSVVNMQDMVTCVPIGDCSGSYRCLGCEATLCGGDALRQHLESPLHKHRTIKRTARNAKEHPSLLPHSACFPNPDTASTSQSAADSKASLSPPSLSASPHATTKSWSHSTPRKPPPLPALSSSSTVTSSLCSTSGVATSFPTDGFSEESDSDLSQKSDRAGSPVGNSENPSCHEDGSRTAVEVGSLRL